MASARFTGIARAGLLALAATLSAVSAGAQEEQTSLAIPAVNLGFLNRYIAEDEGFWKKQGLDVRIQEIAGIGATNAVIAGSMDFGWASGPTITRANARGQKLVALATGMKYSDENIVVRKTTAAAAHFDPAAPLAERARILKGLTIATGGAGAIPDIILKVAQQIAGVPRDALTASPIAPTDFIAAFQSKAIDGFVSGPPYAQVALLDGSGVLVLDTTAGEPKDYEPSPSALLLTRADFCPAHKDICTKLVHGVVEAQKFAHDHPKETVAIMKRHFGTWSDQVLQASYEALVPMMSSPPVTTAQALENSDRLDIAAGFMKPSDKLSNYAAIIDNEFDK